MSNNGTREVSHLGALVIVVLAAVVVLLAWQALQPVPVEATEDRNRILVYTGDGGLQVGYGNMGVATGKTIDMVAALPGDLSPYFCLVLPANFSAFSAATLSALTSYVTAGGRLVAEAENDLHFARAIANMNSVAIALGSNMSVVPASLDAGGHTTTNIDASKFTAGVSSIRYASTSGVQVAGAAESLVRTIGGTTFIGAEFIGSGVFVLTGDSNVFSDNFSDNSGYTVEDNGVLAANICAVKKVTPPPDEQISINVVEKLSGAKLEGTCWRISYGPAKVEHDVVGDDSGGVKPDCGEPSNVKLFDKDPAAGNLRIIITSDQRVQFGDIWHAQMSFEANGNLDTFNYVCDLSLGKCEIGPVAVGGLAVDLDGDLGELPLEAAYSSGPSATVLASIVAAVAAGTIALGSAAWYARMRWLT